MKNVSPTPKLALMVGNSLVTRNDIAHDVAPLKLLDIALASVVNSSPTKTHGIGLQRKFK